MLERGRWAQGAAGEEGGRSAARAGRGTTRIESIAFVASPAPPRRRE